METMASLADHLPVIGGGEEQAVSVVSAKILQLAEEDSEFLIYGEHYEDFHEFETVNVCTTDPAQPQDEYNRQLWTKSGNARYCDLQFCEIEHLYKSDNPILANDPSVFIRTTIDVLPLSRSKPSQKNSRSHAASIDPCLEFHYKHTVYVHSPWSHLSTVTEMLSRTKVACGRYDIEQEDSDETTEVHVHFHRHFLKLRHNVQASPNDVYEDAEDSRPSLDRSSREVSQSSKSTANSHSRSYVKQTPVSISSSHLGDRQSQHTFSHAPDQSSSKPSSEKLLLPPDWPSQRLKQSYGVQFRQAVSPWPSHHEPDIIYGMPSTRSISSEALDWPSQTPDRYIDMTYPHSSVSQPPDWALQQPVRFSGVGSHHSRFQPHYHPAQHPHPFSDVQSPRGASVLRSYDSPNSGYANIQNSSHQPSSPAFQRYPRVLSVRICRPLRMHEAGSSAPPTAMSINNKLPAERSRRAATAPNISRSSKRSSIGPKKKSRSATTPGDAVRHRTAARRAAKPKSRPPSPQPQLINMRRG